MNENIIKTKLASMLVEMYYNKIRSLLCAKQEDTSEFKHLVIKLRNCVNVENNEYHLLSEKDIRTIFTEFDKNGIDNNVDVRISNKIINEKKLRGNFKVKNGVMLSDAITTKVIIDILKRIDKKIEFLKTEGELNDEDIFTLEIYNNAHKINYLSSNNYIEAIALKYFFNVSRIPTIYFNEIEEKFEMNFVTQSKQIFLNYAKDSIQEIANFKNDNEYLTAYASLFELSRTEVILEYLDYDNVKNLLAFLDYNYESDNNEMLNTAKILIKKRKEELQ